MKEKEIVKKLKEGLFEEKDLRILKIMCNMCNDFSHEYPDMKEAIVSDPEAFRNFSILAAACAISMGYTWECDEKNNCSHWDERKKDSEQFCHEHMDIFKSIFKDNAGFPFLFWENQDYRYFTQDVDLRSTPLTRRSALWNELLYFSSVHSTLKQKCMGLFFRILGHGGIYPSLLSDIHFRFI